MAIFLGTTPLTTDKDIFVDEAEDSAKKIYVGVNQVWQRVSGHVTLYNDINNPIWEYWIDNVFSTYSQVHITTIPDGVHMVNFTFTDYGEQYKEYGASAYIDSSEILGTEIVYIEAIPI